MSRHRIAPGTYGEIYTVEDLTAHESKRWQGHVRVVDIDNAQYVVRRWRQSKDAARNAVKDAALNKLKELQAARDAAARAEAIADLGDLVTKIGDLLDRVMTDAPSGLGWKRPPSPGTIGTYRSCVKHIQESWIAELRPRELDVAGVRRYLREHAEGHGRVSAQHAKSLLTKALDRAVETAAMMTPVNVVTATKRAIPDVKVRAERIDHTRSPDTAIVSAMLAALDADEYYGPMLARTKSPHGRAGTNRNPIDVADLLAFTFSTGVRIGEALALRWRDLHLDDLPRAEIVATVRFRSAATARAAGLTESGTVRQERTITASSDRDVPLSGALRDRLARRARVFGIDLNDPSQTAQPVFPSPQFHDRFRDPDNAGKSIRAALTAHGIGYAATHVARKWRITSLADAGVPMSKVADLVGHRRIETTTGYLGRNRQMDADVRAAL